MELQEFGRSSDDILATIASKRQGDARWQEGRTFGLVYDGGPEVHAIAEAVARIYLHDNALNTIAFPSLGEMQSEVCAWTAALLHEPNAAGFLTSGGTESILCAVLAARERGRVERGIDAPEMVLADTAHAAFHKAAHLFGVRVHKVPCRPDFRADVDAMAECVNERTVLVVGSAPQYPQGVVDPIPELSAVAARVGASMHVDACMGGFVLPFVEQLGHAVAPWDFRVEGVTTISADVHKLGYAPKGASVILHRDKRLRQYQTFVFDDWLGGFYASPNLLGSRSGLPIACAWAVMQHLGLDGYRRRTESVLATRDRIVEAITAIDGIEVLAPPDAQIVTMCASPGSGVDVFAVGDELRRRGAWYLDRQTPPDSLHATVSAGNAPVVEEYVADLAASVAAVADTRAADRSTDYSTLD